MTTTMTRDTLIESYKTIIATQQRTIEDLLEAYKKQNVTIESYVKVVRERGEMITKLQKIAEDALAMVKHG